MALVVIIEMDDDGNVDLGVVIPAIFNANDELDGIYVVICISIPVEYLVQFEE